MSKNKPPVTLEQYIARAERDALLSALREARGHRMDTARILDVSRATLFRLMSKHADIAAQFPDSPGPDKLIY